MSFFLNDRGFRNFTCYATHMSGCVNCWTNYGERRIRLEREKKQAALSVTRRPCNRHGQTHGAKWKLFERDDETGQGSFGPKGNQRHIGAGTAVCECVRAQQPRYIINGRIWRMWREPVIVLTTDDDDDDDDDDDENDDDYGVFVIVSVLCSPSVSGGIKSG